MPAMLNTTIAHYKITAKLGQEGMGEVYRAMDTKLGREVAIKVLPEEFASNKERLARFEREAKALAQLNHPNVGSIHGFDVDGGIYFLVLELIEGDTLQERLRRGPLLVEEGLKIFQQIAAALEAAHEKGIVHRDLKPANIKIDAKGQVKVLDFGLAKARFNETASDGTAVDSMAPTITSQFTVPGKVMGTAAYMSPEQSRGQEVDKRTDVWAFGCCLYEALSGRKPFNGQTTSDLLAEILKSDPDFTIVPPETPSEVLALLRRCLEKEPQRRLRDLGDIAITLEDVTETSRIHSAALPSEIVPKSPPASVFHSVKKGLQTVGAVVLALGFAYAVFDLAIGVNRQGATDTPLQTQIIRSVEVLPFENLKPEDNESQFLATTLQSELKKQLGNLEQLEIKTGNSSDVDVIVEGTFVQVADGYHVTVEMTDKTRGVVMLADGFDGSVTNIFPLQNEIAIAVAKKIRSNLSDQEKRLIAAESNIDPLAYIAYRQGLEYYDLFTLEGFATAEDKFKKAIAIDPTFADPYLHRAASIWAPPIWGGTTETPEEAWQRVVPIEAQARRNVGTDEGLVGAGWTFMVRDWNWYLSLARIRKSITNPQSASEVYYAYANYLSLVQGRYWDAMRMALGLPTSF